MSMSTAEKYLIVIPRDDDLMFGLLQSRFHAAWAHRKGSDLEDRPRYTHTTTFATFPFPAGMAPAISVEVARELPAASGIEDAAARLNTLRDGWLYPPDLITVEPEVVPGFPDRLLPRNEVAHQQLSRRTMTALYNERPNWLVEAHQALDLAVSAAYGWPSDISDEEPRTPIPNARRPGRPGNFWHRDDKAAAQQRKSAGGCRRAPTDGAH